MKLPGLLSNVLPKKPEPKTEVFLTCAFHPGSVEACVWDINTKKKPDIIAISTQEMTDDTWAERQRACRLAIEELRGETQEKDVRQVVLGLPSTFLTKAGDIDASVRKDLGKLLRDLNLTPLGFVPVHQAVIYAIKQEEGIPPNVILLNIETTSSHLLLYKVGQLTGEKIIDTTGGIVTGVENGLAEFTDVEVLPSRILLYGGDQALLESAQAELLKHPWQTKANFLHFPKIDIYTIDMILESISLAGASELNLLPPEEEGSPGAAATSDESRENEPEQPAAEPVKTEKSEVIGELKEESNVEVVPPDELGFGAADAFEEETEDADTDAEAPMRRSPGRKRSRFSIALPHLRFLPLPRFGKLRSLRPNILLPKAGLIVPVVVVLLLAFLAVLYWFVPRATITIRVVSQPIDVAQAVTIDPGATEVNAEAKVIPGKQLTKSITGDKTIPVTGKKKVGDPARGTVTIYNKSTSLRTFKKGTVLTSGSLQFALDNDVQVASASENLASSQLTYGKISTTVTAAAIGPESNMPANTEFSFKDVSSSIAVARNDQPLTGGTSRDALVVSRADQDALVKVLSEELTEKAKTELAGNLTLGETLIPETVKTAVTEKKFTQELNAEATELSGSVTVSAAGISFVTNDILSLLKSLITPQVPQGYQIIESDTKSDIGNVKIAKNGKITTDATIHSVAVPVVDTSKIPSAAAGKSIQQFQDYLKNTPGVGAMTFTLSNSPLKSRLPANSANISVVIDVQK